MSPKGYRLCELVFEIVNSLSSMGDKLSPLLKICRCVRKTSQLKKVDLVTFETIQSALSSLQGQPVKIEVDADKPPALEEVLLFCWENISRLVEFSCPCTLQLSLALLSFITKLDLFRASSLDLMSTIYFKPQCQKLHLNIILRSKSPWISAP
jgi:hypothetical protein